MRGTEVLGRHRVMAQGARCADGPQARAAGGWAWGAPVRSQARGTVAVRPPSPDIQEGNPSIGGFPSWVVKRDSIICLELSQPQLSRSGHYMPFMATRDPSMWLPICVREYRSCEMSSISAFPQSLMVTLY
jgi:hypothetical protein